MASVAEIQIGGKPVRIVSRHNRVLIPWAEAKRSAPTELSLITLDHHHDTKTAFVRYAGRSLQRQGHSMDDSGWLDRLGEKQRALVSNLDWAEPSSVLAASDNCDHDEHIDLAIRSGIFQQALVICLQQGHDRPASNEVAAYRESLPSTEEMLQGALAPDDYPERPFTFTPPQDGICAPAAGCFVGCTEDSQDEECLRRRADEVIESAYLNRQLSIAKKMAGIDSLADIDYVLDIDLDLFHTQKSFHPDDPTTFHKLIRGAQMITIAREAGCLVELWLDDEEPDVDEIQEVVLEHIRNALA